MVAAQPGSFDKLVIPPPLGEWWLVLGSHPVLVIYRPMRGGKYKYGRLAISSRKKQVAALRGSHSSFILHPSLSLPPPHTHMFRLASQPCVPV